MLILISSYNTIIIRLPLGTNLMYLYYVLDVALLQLSARGENGETGEAAEASPMGLHLFLFIHVMCKCPPTNTY